MLVTVRVIAEIKINNNRKHRF